MFTLAAEIQNSLPDFHVTPAFLDGQPDLRNVIHDIPQDNVLVIPFMASGGYYTNVVFPKLLQKPGKTIQFADAIGTQPGLNDLVHARLNTLMTRIQGNETVEVIVVGHGTRRNRNSCRTTINLAKGLRPLNPNVEIQFGFIDQNPPLDHVIGKITSSNVIVIPFLMGLGPHTTDDVPEAFGIGNIRQHVFDPGFEFPLSTESDSGRFTVIMDAPVGTYIQLTDLCVQITKEACRGVGNGSDDVIEVPA